MKKYLFIVFVLASMNLCLAQNELQNVQTDYEEPMDSLIPIPKWQITSNMFSLLSLNPGIHLGIERKLFNNFRIELEGKYLLPIVDPREGLRQGLRSVLNLKYRVGKRNSINLSLVYQKVFHQDYMNYSRFGDAFFERVIVKRDKELLGPSIGFSRIFNNENIEWGVTFGRGRYKVNVEKPSIAAEAELIEDFSDENYAEEGVYNKPITLMFLKIKFGL